MFGSHLTGLHLQNYSRTCHMAKLLAVFATLYGNSSLVQRCNSTNSTRFRDEVMVMVSDKVRNRNKWHFWLQRTMAIVEQNPTKLGLMTL